MGTGSHRWNYTVQNFDPAFTRSRNSTHRFGVDERKRFEYVTCEGELSKRERTNICMFKNQYTFTNVLDVLSDIMFCIVLI